MTSAARSRIVCYLAASALAVGGVIVLELFHRTYSGPAPLTILLLPIVVAAYRGRLGPGLLATAVTTLGAALFVEPNAGSVARLTSLLAVGTVMCALVEQLHRARVQAVTAQRETDATVQRLAQMFEASKASENAARQNADLLREFADSIQEVFWITTPDNSKMLYISPNYERIFGRSCEELYRDPRSWLVAVHPDDRERVARPPVLPSTDTYRIVRPDRSVRTIQINLFPIKDAAGAEVRMAGIAADVTDQQVLEEQLRQTQKLESLGLLAGGVAHDFNNVLAVIAANSNLLADVIAPDHADRELVDEIDAAVTRATSLTRQLLAFSRKQVVEPVVIDLNDAVTDTRKMLRRMVGEDIVIATSLEPELGHVRIDPGHLVQVIMNLTVNARDAMPRGGTLALATRAFGNEMMLSITDTGCGMPPEVRARVFEPFFTTKGVGKGTGLGLSVVHGIVQQANGRIELESAPDVGTCFRIYFPKVDAPADRISDIATAGASGTERIVLVDDDMFVRASTSRALRARGYHVLEAADARDALRLLHDHSHDVALLVTDVVMPGMDGRELVEAARARRPSLKVLYISGYNDDAVIRHGVMHAEVNILEKPFPGHSLATKVRQILDAV